MKVIWAREEIPAFGNGLIPNSIFLAGPTPRDENTKSWRPRALELLKDFDGIVLVPEDQNWGLRDLDYDEQIWWEITCLGSASCILFWIPRHLPEMPAFTTNTEFGFLMALRSERMVVGIPPDAEKTTYHKTLWNNLYMFRRAFSQSVDPIISYSDMTHTCVMNYHPPVVYNTLEETTIVAMQKARDVTKCIMGTCK